MPFVKGNKNDRNDAFAITEAANRPDMHFVQPRSLPQTDMMLLHKLRHRRVEQRTALMNQLRGFLSEYGIVIRSGKAALQQALPELLEETDCGLTATARQIIASIKLEWEALQKSIDTLDKRMLDAAKSDDNAKRLMQIKGVAEKTATAVVAHAGNGAAYKNGRHFSANLGLVPKEYSSGGKQQLGGITKRGNAYIRRLLVQGAWCIIRHVSTSSDRLSRWAEKLIERRGKHKAAVAVANKLARIIWSMLYHQTDYQAG